MKIPNDNPWPKLTSFIDDDRSINPNDTEDILNAAELALEKYALSRHGCIISFEDFNYVLFDKKSFCLEDAKQAHEVIKFLCKNAIGRNNAKLKTEIIEHVKRTCGVVPDDFGPSQPFRNNLRPLYNAVMCDKIKGIYSYWIMPE